MSAPGSYATETSDMIAVHQALMGALQAAPTLVSSAGDSSDRVDLIGSYCENVLEFLHVHHAGEDELIYPILEERRAEDKSMPQRIGAQHGLLNEPMTEARSAIAAWRASPSVEGGHTVVSLITTIDETLRPHLEEEETEVLPVASAWISPEEWSQLPGHALQSFSGDKPWLALGLVRERFTSEQRDQMLSGMPPCSHFGPSSGSRRSTASWPRFVSSHDSVRSDGRLQCWWMDTSTGRFVRAGHE